MVRYCDQCGNKLKENAVFCSNCGTKCDLPPEKNVKDESTQKKVNDTVKNNAEPIDEKANENTETIGMKIDNVISKGNKNSDGGFDLNNIDLNVVIKYSLVATILSLILGMIFVFITMPTATHISLLSRSLGLVPYSFYLALIIIVLIFSAHVKEGINAITIGAISGLLTGIFQSPFFIMFYGYSWDLYFGNQTLFLLILGIISAYVGNVYLKDKVNLPIINQYLGE